MALAPVDAGGGSPGDEKYNLVAAARTSRVNSDNTVEEIVQVTAQSQKYLVTYTWFVETKTWDTDGAAFAIEEKTMQVNEVCSLNHVIGFRTVQDQDASRLLVNYAVITVGTEDGAIQDETQVRMDQLGSGAAATAVNATWARLAKLGAT